MKIQPAGAELFHEDRRTDRRGDMTKQMVAIRNVGNVPKKCTVVISVGAEAETLSDARLAMPVLNSATCHEGAGKLHLVTFLTSGLDGVDWSASCSLYSLSRKLRGLQDWSGCFGEENNLLPLMGIGTEYLSFPMICCSYTKICR